MLKISIPFFRKTFFLLVFFCYISSLSPWFAIGNAVYVLSLIVLLIQVLIVKKYNSAALPLRLTTRNVTFSILVLGVGLYMAKALNVNGAILLITSAVIAGIAFSLERKMLIDLLGYITKGMAYLLLISMIAYIVYFFTGFTLFTPSVIEYYEYTLVNHYLFVFRTYTVDVDDIVEVLPRFYSIFLEPGHLTMGLAPLLALNRYNVRNKYVAILMIAQFLTMSLAGIIVTIVGVVLFSIKGTLKKTLITILFVCMAFWALGYFLGEDRMEQLVWQRLTVEDGKLAGDNRVTPEFERFYQHFLKTDKCVLGDSSVDLLAFYGVSGYRVFHVRYGYVGLFLVFLLYSYGWLRNKNYETGAFCLLFIMLLYQNAYPLWIAVILLYIIGIRLFERTSPKY